MHPKRYRGLLHWRGRVREWMSRGRGDADEYCRRGFLSRCNPECNPNSASTFNSASKKVLKSWTIVSKAVISDMYNPISSDIVSFRYDDLKLRLGLSLRSIGALNEL